MSYVSGMMMGASSGPVFGGVVYSVVTPTKQRGMSQMQMMTASDTWQAVACPSSTSRFVSRGGMSDYEITSADMLTKRTSEIR
jgi:hypothetical protein